MWDFLLLPAQPFLLFLKTFLKIIIILVEPENTTVSLAACMVGDGTRDLMSTCLYLLCHLPKRSRRVELEGFSCCRGTRLETF